MQLLLSLSNYLYLTHEFSGLLFQFSPVLAGEGGREGVAVWGLAAGGSETTAVLFAAQCGASRVWDNRFGWDVLD